MRRYLFIAIVMLAACSKKPPVAGPKIDPSLAMLVPGDTTFMVGTRVEALLKTPVYQKFFANRKMPQIDEFARRTALDPRKELWELLFVSNGKQQVLLGRGHFSDQLEDPRIQKNGASAITYKGTTIVGGDPTAVMFINTSTAAVGTVGDLKALIDQREQYKGPPAAVAALMKDIPPDSQFWAAYGGGPFDLSLPGNLSNVSKILGTMQTGTIYFDLRAGLHGVAEGNASSEDGAQQVHDALKALVGFGRLSQPQLAEAYDGIRVTLESRKVKLYVDVQESLVDRFLGSWLK